MLVNASNLLKDHKFQEANNIYQNLILQFPESHQVYHDFGVALINQNQPKFDVCPYKCIRPTFVLVQGLY